MIRCARCPEADLSSPCSGRLPAHLLRPCDGRSRGDWERLGSHKQVVGFGKRRSNWKQNRDHHAGVEWHRRSLTAVLALLPCSGQSSNNESSSHGIGAERGRRCRPTSWQVACGGLRLGHARESTREIPRDHAPQTFPMPLTSLELGSIRRLSALPKILFVLGVLGTSMSSALCFSNNGRSSV